MTTKTKTNSRKKNTKQSVKALVKTQLTALSETKMRNATSLQTEFSSISNEWINIPLTNISLGTDFFQRIGAKILLKSIEFRGVLVGGANESAFDDPYNVIRIVLSRWDGEAVTPFSTLSGHSIHNPINRTIAGCPGMKSKYYDKYIAMNVSSPEKERVMVTQRLQGLFPLKRHLRKEFRLYIVPLQRAISFSYR